MKLQSRDSLDYTVYTRIKEMIVGGQLKPGEWIVQSRLSVELGASRTPLRKAIGELEKEGLLGGSPKGWYVKQFSVKDMISIFEIRAVLEGLACRYAAAQLEPADIAYLRTMFLEGYKPCADNKMDAYYRADLKFHAYLTEASADEMLKQSIASNQVIVTSQLPGLFRHPDETYGEHLMIIDALADRNGELAESLMRDHIRKAIPLLRSGSYTLYK